MHLKDLLNSVVIDTWKYEDAGIELLSRIEKYSAKDGTYAMQNEQRESICNAEELLQQIIKDIGFTDTIANRESLFYKLLAPNY